VLSYLWSPAQTEFYVPYVVERLLLNINCFISVFTRNSDLSVTGRCTVQKISATYAATGMKKRKT